MRSQLFLSFPPPIRAAGCSKSPFRGAALCQNFTDRRSPGYSGRSTVPVLWDSQTQTIVNNESAEIIVILNGAFNEFAAHPEVDLYPADCQTAIDSWNDRIYHAVKQLGHIPAPCGFAQSQVAYDQACASMELLKRVD